MKIIFVDGNDSPGILIIYECCMFIVDSANSNIEFEVIVHLLHERKYRYTCRVSMKIVKCTWGTVCHGRF